MLGYFLSQTITTDLPRPPSSSSHDQNYHRVRDVRKLLRAGNFCVVFLFQVVTVYKDILPAVLIA